VLVYYEVFKRIDEAFEREKQIQGWRRESKRKVIIIYLAAKVTSLRCAFRPTVPYGLQHLHFDKLSAGSGILG